MFLVQNDSGNAITPDQLAAGLHLDCLIIPPPGAAFVGLELTMLLNQIFVSLNGFPSLSRKSNLYIELPATVRQIDLLNIGIIGLIRKQHPGLEIIFNFSESPSANVSYTQLYFKLLHYQASGYLSFNGDLFSVKTPQDTFPVRYSEGTHIKKETWFRISDSYLPVLFIENRTYSISFEMPLDIGYKNYLGNTISVFDQSGQNNSEKLFHTIRKTVLESDNITLQDLSFLYYLKFLYRFHLIHFHLSTDPYIQNHKEDFKTLLALGGKIKPWSWREIDCQEYTKKAAPRLRELQNKPPAYLMLFSLICNNKLKNLEDSYPVMTEILALIDSAIYVTSEIFWGLKELAKNIVEHSIGHFGVMLGRMFSADNLRHLKGRNLPQLNFYLDKKNDDNIFLDLHIIDKSNLGIPDTLGTSLQAKLGNESLSPRQKDLIREDLVRLAETNLRLSDMFIPSRAVLNHQSTRAVSSIGLQIFSNKVKNFKGYFFISSPNNHHVESISYYEDIQEGVAENNRLFTVGTMYNLILPFEIAYRRQPLSLTNPHLVNTVPAEAEFNAFMNMRYLREGDTPKAALGTDRLIFFAECILQKGTPDTKYADECKITLDITERMLLFSKQAHTIPVLNCRNIADPSTLYRILVTLQFLHGIKDIICIEVNEDMFSEVNNIAKLTGDDDGFWETGCVVLFYIDHLLPDGITVFAPALITGKTYHDCLLMNALCARNMPLYFPMIDLPPLQEVPLLTSSAIISETCTLRPVDMIIENGNRTIYENNTLAILNLPI